jgi:hypothetical protein
MCIVRGCGISSNRLQGTRMFSGGISRVFHMGLAPGYRSPCGSGPNEGTWGLPCCTGHPMLTTASRRDGRAAPGPALRDMAHPSTKVMVVVVEVVVRPGNLHISQTWRGHGRRLPPASSWAWPQRWKAIARARRWPASPQPA